MSDISKMRGRVDALALRAQEMILCFGAFSKASELWKIQRDFELKLSFSNAEEIYGEYISCLLNFCKEVINEKN